MIWPLITLLLVSVTRILLTSKLESAVPEGGKAAVPEKEKTRLISRMAVILFIINSDWQLVSSLFVDNVSKYHSAWLFLRNFRRLNRRTVIGCVCGWFGATVITGTVSL